MMERNSTVAGSSRLWLASAVAAAVLLQLGCDRKPGDGPSAVSPPSNVRQPDMMGAQPAGGPATPMAPGPQGPGVPAPSAAGSGPVDEGAKGQAPPQAGGGATNDPQLLDKDRERREAAAQTDERTAAQPAADAQQPRQVQAQAQQPLQPGRVTPAPQGQQTGQPAQQR
jgi:hypothetical protein